MVNILIVDDKKSMREMLKMALQEKYNIFIASNGIKALDIVEKNKIDIIISDMKMPKLGGIELLEKLRGKNKDINFIIITAYGTVQDAVKSMKLGAIDFIEKPFKISLIEEKIKDIIKKKNLDNSKDNKIEDIEESSEKFGEIVGKSKVMQELYELIEKVANTNASVLILGESGTGKELVAREIHKRSERKDKTFIAINCGALVETLLEDELFGHEKGAFTGAVTQKKGRFELADKGTIFLDEIAEMGLNLQVKLLRVLQEKSFERVGGTEK